MAGICLPREAFFASHNGAMNEPSRQPHLPRRITIKRFIYDTISFPFYATSRTACAYFFFRIYLHGWQFWHLDFFMVRRFLFGLMSKRLGRQQSYDTQSSIVFLLSPIPIIIKPGLVPLNQLDKGPSFPLMGWRYPVVPLLSRWKRGLGVKTTLHVV